MHGLYTTAYNPPPSQQHGGTWPSTSVTVGQWVADGSRRARVSSQPTPRRIISALPECQDERDDNLHGRLHADSNCRADDVLRLYVGQTPQVARKLRQLGEYEASASTLTTATSVARVARFRWVSRGVTKSRLCMSPCFSRILSPLSPYHPPHMHSMPEARKVKAQPQRPTRIKKYSARILNRQF